MSGAYQWTCRRLCFAGDEHGCVCGDGSGFDDFTAQAEPGQSFLSPATDEFAADAVAWVAAGFPNGYRDAVLTKADARYADG